MDLTSGKDFFSPLFVYIKKAVTFSTFLDSATLCGCFGCESALSDTFFRLAGACVGLGRGFGERVLEVGYIGVVVWQNGCARWG